MSTNHPKCAQTDHPIVDVLAERYSPYAFDPRPVERDKLLSCLEAARWAASSFNEQPWRYILAQRDDAEAFERMLGCLVEANQAWARRAGALVIACTKRHFTRNDKPNKVAEHDLALAAANLTVQAQSMGLHVHQMAGIDPGTCRVTYRIPDEFEPLTAIAIGYAADPDRLDDAELAERDTAPRSRMPLSAWVFGEAFGESSPVV
jgi:nitroreductase